MKITLILIMLACAYYMLAFIEIAIKRARFNSGLVWKKASKMQWRIEKQLPDTLTCRVCGHPIQEQYKHGGCCDEYCQELYEQIKTQSHD